MSYSTRLCRAHDEFEACVRLEKEIWGYGQGEPYPARLFINLGKIGGHTIGAFTPAGEIVGFVASMPAWRGRERYFHSLSLGVAAGHENRGLGRALKLNQRRRALAEGIRRIEWTFDPLRAKNAFFNLVRLGAICRRYHPDYYGRVGSRLQLGLPSDRLVAEWDLDSARVERAVRGQPARCAGKPPVAVIAIPGDLEALARSDPGRVRAVQAEVRAQFLKHFKRGLAATGFERGEGRAHYLLDEP